MMQMKILFWLLFLSTICYSKKTHFDILGVTQRSSDAEISKAYRKLAVKYHPDKNSDPSAQERFIEVTSAYEVLSDPQRKRDYLVSLQYGGDEPSGRMRQRGNPRRGPDFHQHFGNFFDDDDEEEEVFIIRTGNGQQFFSRRRQRPEFSAHSHFHRQFHHQHFHHQEHDLPWWVWLAFAAFQLPFATWLVIVISSLWLCSMCCAASGEDDDDKGRERGDVPASSRRPSGVANDNEDNGKDNDQYALSLRSISRLDLVDQKAGTITVVSLSSACDAALDVPRLRALNALYSRGSVPILFLRGNLQEKYKSTGLLAIALKKKGTQWSGLIARSDEGGDGDQGEGDLRLVDRMLQKFCTKMLNGEVSWIATTEYPLPLEVPS